MFILYSQLSDVPVSFPKSIQSPKMNAKALHVLPCTSTQILNWFSVCVWLVGCSVVGCVFILGLV